MAARKQPPASGDIQIGKAAGVKGCSLRLRLRNKRFQRFFVYGNELTVSLHLDDETAKTLRDRLNFAYPEAADGLDCLHHKAMLRRQELVHDQLDRVEIQWDLD